MITLLLLSLLPGLLIGIWVYYQDKYEKEPVKLMIRAFFYGCLSTIPPMIFQVLFSSFENPDSLFLTAIFTFGVVAFSEETSKFFFLRRYIYPNPEFDEPVDGVIYGTMIGMGFATTENILYVLGESGGFSTAIGRAFTAVPAHAIFAIFMGAYMGIAKFNAPSRYYYMLKGWLLAILFHGLYDFFLIQKAHQELMILSLIVLVWGFILARRIIKVSQNLSPFKDHPKGEDIPPVV